MADHASSLPTPGEAEAFTHACFSFNPNERAFMRALMRQQLRLYKHAVEEAPRLARVRAHLQLLDAAEEKLRQHAEDAATDRAFRSFLSRALHQPTTRPHPQRRPASSDRNAG